MLDLSKEEFRKLSQGYIKLTSVIEVAKYTYQLYADAPSIGAGASAKQITI